MPAELGRIQPIQILRGSEKPLACFGVSVFNTLMAEIYLLESERAN